MTNRNILAASSAIGTTRGFRWKGPDVVPLTDDIMTTSNSTMYQREDECRHSQMGVKNVDGYTALYDIEGNHRDPSSNVTWDLFPSEDYKKDYFHRERLFYGLSTASLPKDNRDPPIDSLFPGTNPHLCDFPEEREMIKTYNVEGPATTLPDHRTLQQELNDEPLGLKQGVHRRGIGEEFQ
jgi:hypothetical protein